MGDYLIFESLEDKHLFGVLHYLIFENWDEKPQVEVILRNDLTDSEEIDKIDLFASEVEHRMIASEDSDVNVPYVDYWVHSASLCTAK